MEKKSINKILVDCLYCHRKEFLGETELINVPMALLEVSEEIKEMRNCIEDPITATLQSIAESLKLIVDNMTEGTG